MCPRRHGEILPQGEGSIFPTLFGPTNIPPLEAFVLGCPVAVSGIYGMPEQIGDAGLLFDPRSVHSIANSIMRLWVDDALCQKLRVQGKAKAAAWGRDQFGAALEAIIRQLTSASACEKDAENQPKISGTWHEDTPPEIWAEADLRSPARPLELQPSCVRGTGAALRSRAVLLARPAATGLWERTPAGRSKLYIFPFANAQALGRPAGHVSARAADPHFPAQTRRTSVIRQHARF